MRIYVIYDNIAKKGFIPAWGLSMLIETSDGEKVLFDTGGSGKVFEHNLRKLNLDLKGVRHIFLSHFHWDHIGGALDIAYFEKGKHFVITDGFSKVFTNEIALRGHQVSLAREPYRFAENFLSTGGMKTGINNLKEHSLISYDGEEYILAVGCSHPGILEITRRAIDLTKKPPKLVIGGFHLFNADEITLISVAEELLHLGVKYVAPNHCTGEKGREIFRDVFGDMFIDARAGEIIEI